MAFFNEGMPPTGVYFVLPSLMAWIAPCLINSGVSKSGSPAAKPIMSIPCDFNNEAFAVTARVGDSLIRWTAEDKVILSDKVSSKIKVFKD